MAEQTVTAILTGPWVYDKRYEKGESVTIPKSLYDDLKGRFPEMFEAIKKGE